MDFDALCDFDGHFHWRKCYGLQTSILATSDSLKLKHLNNRYVSYKHAAFSFTRQLDYVWIIEKFFSVVWSLILTAPIHCRGSNVSKRCNATFLQI